MIGADQHAHRGASGPYDLLREAGIGPESSMKEILDASFVMMELRRWSPDVRTAWDKLRTVEQRLAADFLLIERDISTETASARQAVLAALQQQSRTDPAELYDLDRERREITLDSLAAPATTAFDQLPPLPGATVVEFDQ